MQAQRVRRRHSNEVFGLIRAMESEALSVWAEQSEKNQG